MNLQQIFLKSKQLIFAKSKTIPSEENPEEFQALQKAYKIAAQYAKRNKTVSSRKQPETPGNMLPLWDFKANAPISQVQSPDEQSLQEQVLKKLWNSERRKRPVRSRRRSLISVRSIHMVIKSGFSGNFT